MSKCLNKNWGNACKYVKMSDYADETIRKKEYMKKTKESLINYLHELKSLSDKKIISGDDTKQELRKAKKLCVEVVKKAKKLED